MNTYYAAVWSTCQSPNTRAVVVFSWKQRKKYYLLQLVLTVSNKEHSSKQRQEHITIGIISLAPVDQKGQGNKVQALYRRVGAWRFKASGNCWNINYGADSL